VVQIGLLRGEKLDGVAPLAWLWSPQDLYGFFLYVSLMETMVRAKNIRKKQNGNNMYGWHRSLIKKQHNTHKSMYKQAGYLMWHAITTGLQPHTQLVTTDHSAESYAVVMEPLPKARIFVHFLSLSTDVLIAIILPFWGFCPGLSLMCTWRFQEFHNTISSTEQLQKIEVVTGGK
jgi:hypothetical protein